MQNFIVMFDLLPFAGVLLFIALDVVSGLIKAGATGTLSSSVMRTGLWHKSALILLEVTAYAAGSVAHIFPAIPAELGMVYVAVSGYVIIMELVSILENVSVANPDIANGKLYNMFGVDDEFDELSRWK